MIRPAVSVIVPVYQSEKYIKECIDSILSQTFTDFELLLIDDGSTDQSGIICDYYAHFDKRITVIHQENMGAAAARNTGLEICHGEYIAFVDADDRIDCKFLEYAIHSMQNNPIDLFISGMNIEFWEAGVVIRTLTCGVTEDQYYSIKELLENMDRAYSQICICGPVCKLYRRTIIQKYNIRFVESFKYSEDTNFNLDYYSYCDQVLFSHMVFYHYRQGNGESLTGRFHRDIYEVHKKVWDKMRILMQTIGCSKVAMDWFEALYFTMLLGCIFEYYLSYAKTTSQERYAQIVKVAKDPHIKKVRTHYISNWKFRILWCLLRLKWYGILVLILEYKFS